MPSTRPIHALTREPSRAVIRLLHHHGSLSSHLIYELAPPEFTRQTLWRSLAELEALGVIETAVPLGERRARRIDYTLNARSVRNIFAADLADLLST